LLITAFAFAPFTLRFFFFVEIFALQSRGSEELTLTPAPAALGEQVRPGDLAVVCLTLVILVALCPVGALDVADSIDAVSCDLLTGQLSAALAGALTGLSTVYARHALTGLETFKHIG